MNIWDGNSKKFINTYDELDGFIRKYLNVDKGPSHKDLIRQIALKSKIFNRFKNDLETYTDLRNFIIHNPSRRFADPIAEPHDYIVNKYEEIKNYVMNPPNALENIAIRENKIYTTNLNAVADDVMKEMNTNTYTHVPVIEEGKLIGVFSENTIFSYIVKNQDVIIEKEALIKEFADFIPLNEHKSEYFEFVSRDATVTEIEEIFQIGLKDEKRIAVIFITQNGKISESLQGMITAWDLAGYIGY